MRSLRSFFARRSQNRDYKKNCEIGLAIFGNDAKSAPLWLALFDLKAELVNKLQGADGGVAVVVTLALW